MNKMEMRVAIEAAITSANEAKKVAQAASDAANDAYKASALAGERAGRASVFAMNASRTLNELLEKLAGN